jgi:hypothetical protein
MGADRSRLTFATKVAAQIRRRFELQSTTFFGGKLELESLFHPAT